MCKRAKKLNTDTCLFTDQGCGRIYQYTSGSTITYGSLGTSGVLNSGDAFDCDVNGDGVYDSETERFYYVSDLYNTTTKSFDTSYAVLIYNSNTTNGIADNTHSSLIAYDSSNYHYYGPRTAITNLPTINQWSNVRLSNTNRAIITETGSNSTSNVNLPTNFSYSGYAARLITAQEINFACGVTVGNKETGELRNCEYLFENLQ